MKLRTLVFGSTLLLGALGCSSSDSTDKPTNTGAAGETGTGAGGDSGGGEQVLQLFSWWVAPGETEALRALEDTYQDAHAGARVNQYSKPSAANWQEVLGAEIDDSPWD